MSAPTPTRPWPRLSRSAELTNIAEKLSKTSTLMEKTPLEFSVIAPRPATDPMRIAWNVLEHTDSNPGTASALVNYATPPLAPKCPWLSCPSLRLSDLLWRDLCKQDKLELVLFTSNVDTSRTHFGSNYWFLKNKNTSESKLWISFVIVCIHFKSRNVWGTFCWRSLTMISENTEESPYQFVLKFLARNWKYLWFFFFLVMTLKHSLNFYLENLWFRCFLNVLKSKIVFVFLTNDLNI